MRPPVRCKYRRVKHFVTLKKSGQQGVGVCEAETSLNECVLEPAEKRGTLRIKFINFWDKFDPSTYFVVDILVALFLDAGVKLCMLPDHTTEHMMC
eukprot:jgi/Picre1/35033/NNA_002498.t1